MSRELFANLRSAIGDDISPAVSDRSVDEVASAIAAISGAIGGLGRRAGDGAERKAANRRRGGHAAIAPAAAVVPAATPPSAAAPAAMWMTW